MKKTLIYLCPFGLSLSKPLIAMDKPNDWLGVYRFFSASRRYFQLSRGIVGIDGYGAEA